MLSRISKHTGMTAVIVIVATILLTGELAGPAWAWRSPPPGYWRGPAFRGPSRDHVMIRYRGGPYYYTGGWFYRRGSGRLVLVAPPFGVVVPVLPLGFATLVLGGMTYYELHGVYYRQVPEGYVVVEQPAGVTTPAAPASDGTMQVVVQSELLNVRSGPGLEQDIIVAVNRGTTLKVIGSAPDWYYVEMGDGERGWVMQKFVVPVKPVPQG